MKSGILAMLARTNTKVFWNSESKDQGLNWSLPKPTEIPCGNAPAAVIKSGEYILIPCNYGKNRTQLVVAKLESFNEKLNSPTFVNMVDRASLKNTNQFVHPSGCDNAVTYPSMVDCGMDTTLMAWSSYMINDTVHKGTINYCLVIDSSI
jgi:hypothetical protein